jgi:hypothetical protein
MIVQCDGVTYGEVVERINDKLPVNCRVECC